MRIVLEIWRQKDAKDPGRFVTYEVPDVNEHMSFLEMLDVLNRRLVEKGEEPVAFDSDCREGICGTCGFLVNGVAHGPLRNATICQTHMRHFHDGETLRLEPWRAAAFPVLKDLCVDRSALDRIIAAGGYVSGYISFLPLALSLNWNLVIRPQLGFNNPETAVTENIRFINNTCVDAGFGWGHRQRPDPNGRHLMFYDNSAATEDVIIRHNVFSRATDSCLRLHGKDWTAALRMDRNCWYQPEGPMAQWGNEQVESERFPEFQRRRGMDGQSIVADPGFVDPGRRDYRLAAGSPARGIIESRLLKSVDGVLNDRSKSIF